VSAALTASFDLAKVALPEVLKLLGPKQAELEAKLGLPAGTNGAALVTALGIDPARPMTLAQLGLGDEARSAMAALRSLVPAKDPLGGRQPGAVQPTGLYDKLKLAMAPVPELVGYRILIPAKDPARVQDVAAKILQAAGLAPFPEGGGFKSRHLYAVVGADGPTVVVDVVGADGGLLTVTGLRNTTRAGGAAEGAAPALPPDSAFAIQFIPERIAEQGFMANLRLTNGALSGQTVDPTQKERITQQGLWEAAESFVVATAPSGARFDTVLLSARLDPGHTKLTMRAEPGPGYDGPGEGAWGTTYAVSSSATAVGSGFDLSRPFLDAWRSPAPPGGAAATALDAKGILRQTRG
jgi:hypothetical protein